MLRRIRILDHAKFANGIDGGINGEAVSERLHERDTVESEIVAFRALAVYRKPKTLCGGIELLRGAVRIRRHRPWREQREL